MKRTLLVLAAIAAAVCTASASDVDALPIDPFATVRGISLSWVEAATFTGGDVIMSLNADRTLLTVKVYDNDKTSRQGLEAPREVYTVPVHNRVVDTKAAPYMPAEKVASSPGAARPVTSKPEPFPAGTWKVTQVKEVEGSYGPCMIRTNAKGRVMTYDENGKCLGRREDVGYALHANSNYDFSASKSYGCLVLKQDDVAKVAETLREDYAADHLARQELVVNTSR